MEALALSTMPHIESLEEDFFADYLCDKTNWLSVPQQDQFHSWMRIELITAVKNFYADFSENCKNNDWLKEQAEICWLDENAGYRSMAVLIALNLLEDFNPSVFMENLYELEYIGRPMAELQVSLCKVIRIQMEFSGE